MSRHYEMNLNITGYDRDRTDAIIRACKGEWQFQDDAFDPTPAEHYTHGSELTVRGEGNLAGGEGEEEFADRLAAAVWKANGTFCRVQVEATYLEDLPYELHVRDQDAYDRWRQHG